MEHRPLGGGCLVRCWRKVFKTDHPISLIVGYSPCQCAPSGRRCAGAMRLLIGSDSGAHCWTWALESVIRTLRIQTLKGQVAMCELRSASLAKRLDSEYMSDEQKVEIEHRREESLKEGRTLQLMLDLLERQEREGGSNRQ
jgi:hypothetical protein